MANIMKNFLSIFAKKETKKTVIEINTGNKMSYAGYAIGDSVTQEQEAVSILDELRNTTDIGEQIEIIAKKDPDVSQSIWAFQRLCMQGINIEIKDLNGKRLVEQEELFKQQSNNWNQIGADGLEGIIDNLHRIGLLYNIMMVEVVVDKTNTNTFSGIYFIDPRTVEFTLEKRDGVEKWIPYQDQDGDKIDLTKGNVYWVSVNPDITSPTGPYLLESAVTAIDYKLQTIRDSSAVLRSQGYPYSIFTIDKQRVIQTLPPSLRNDRKKVKEAIQDAVSLAQTVSSTRQPTQDIVVTDDIKIEKSSNASASSSVDVRGWFEIIDIQILNALKTLGFLMNRNSGSTESWGTVQMKLITDMVTSFQNNSKKIIENIGAIWLQLNGIQGNLKLEFNPLEYQNEEQKWKAQYQKDEHFKAAEDQGWINKDEAANGALGVEKATGTVENSQNSNNSEEGE